MAQLERIIARRLSISNFKGKTRMGALYINVESGWLDQLDGMIRITWIKSS